MAVPMRSTQFRSVVEPILNHVFDGVYEQRKDEWKQLFKQITGTPRNYHEEPVLAGFGAAPKIPDGKPVTYQQSQVLFIKRYVYDVFGTAFALTKILVDDGDHIKIGSIYSRQLAQALVETKETVTANQLNRAFTVGYEGGDGVTLGNTAHPIVGGTFSNMLATAAALSQTSLEQMLQQITLAVDNNGKRIRLEKEKLFVAASNEMQAEVITKSVLRSGVANNDINPIKSKGLLSGGVALISRFTSQTMWGVKTGDAGRGPGLQLVMRTPLAKRMEGDFETNSMRYAADERYDAGWTDPRVVWITPGL